MSIDFHVTVTSFFMLKHEQKSSCLLDNSFDALPLFCSMCFHRFFKKKTLLEYWIIISIKVEKYFHNNRFQFLYSIYIYFSFHNPKPFKYSSSISINNSLSNISHRQSYLNRFLVEENRERVNKRERRIYIFQKKSQPNKSSKQDVCMF